MLIFLSAWYILENSWFPEGAEVVAEVASQPAWHSFIYLGVILVYAHSYTTYLPISRKEEEEGRIYQLITSYATGFFRPPVNARQTLLLLFEMKSVCLCVCVCVCVCLSMNMAEFYSTICVTQSCILRYFPFRCLIRNSVDQPDEF